MDPLSLGLGLASTGLNLGLGLSGRRKQKAAEEAARAANERRYLRTLDLLREQGAATKADIRAGAASERAAAVQGSIGRGLYNTSFLDTVQSQANDREARALANVDQDTARQLAGVMSSRSDEYPDGDGGAANFAAAGQGLAAVAGDLIRSRQPQQPQARVSDRYAMMAGNAAGAAPMGAGGAVQVAGAAVPMARQVGAFGSRLATAAVPGRMRSGLASRMLSRRNPYASLFS